MLADVKTAKKRELRKLCFHAERGKQFPRTWVPWKPEGWGGWVGRPKREYLWENLYSHLAH